MGFRTGTQSGPSVGRVCALGEGLYQEHGRESCVPENARSKDEVEIKLGGLDTVVNFLSFLKVDLIQSLSPVQNQHQILWVPLSLRYNLHGSILIRDTEWDGIR